MNTLAQSMARALVQHGRVRREDVAADGAAFAAALRALREAGFALRTSDPSAVSLTSPVSPLDECELRAALEPTVAAALSLLHVDVVSASTNQAALAAAPPAPGRLHVFAADFQWAGQGRRGARWSSPPTTGLCLSVALRLPATRDLSTFSLACGVSVQRALIAAGVPGVQLKWPNDLVVDAGKVGGLLVQVRQMADGPSLVVVGLGLNVTDVPAAVDAHALPPIALADLAGVRLASRSVLAARLIGALWHGAMAFAADGFAPFDARWRDADFLCGRTVAVSDERGAIEGIARGVNGRGELLVETGGGLQAVNAGQVSVRPVTTP